MSGLSGSVVLVTGGAGSLGQYVVMDLVRIGATVRVFDSNEYGLFLLGRQMDDRAKRRRVRLLQGDVRDRERVRLAMKGADCVVHTAALKNLEVTEYNVPETIRTNIEGTINMVELAMAEEVSRFMFVSSDKAVNSPTLYGSTKYVGERVVLWANRVTNQKFSCVRMGNFLDARGNVFELWQQQSKAGQRLTLTHPDMRRYYFSTVQAARFVVSSLAQMKGGEVFVPKMKEYSVFEMMKSLYPRSKWTEIGLRPGERMREDLLTADELKRAAEFKDKWVIKA